MYYPDVVLPVLFAIHPDCLGLLILILQLLKPQPCPGAYSRISVAVGERVFSWCRGIRLGGGDEEPEMLRPKSWRWSTGRDPSILSSNVFFFALVPQTIA